MRAARPVRFRVVPSEQGTMLFHLVARRLPDTSPQKARELVQAGGVYMGHLRVRVPTTRVAAGERITVWPGANEIAPLDPDTIRFVHRDPAFVVIDKPAGIAVAQTRATARGTLSEALRRRLRSEGVARPYVGVVHRLDRGASGLVLFTIRSIANKSVHQQFVDHSIDRTYRLRVHGDAPQGMRCEAPLRPDGEDGMCVAVDGEARAQAACTAFVRLDPLEAMPGTSLLEATLRTGRTHQIRVHAATLGFPIVGDRRYGRDDGAARMHLHAAALAFSHPIDGGPVAIAAELPGWACDRGESGRGTGMGAGTEERQP